MRIIARKASLPGALGKTIVGKTTGVCGRATVVGNAEDAAGDAVAAAADESRA